MSLFRGDSKPILENLSFFFFFYLFPLKSYQASEQIHPLDPALLHPALSKIYVTGRQKTFLVSRGHIQHLMKEEFLSKLLERHPDSVASSSCLDPSLLNFQRISAAPIKVTVFFTGHECRRFTSPSPFSLRVPHQLFFPPPSAGRFGLHHH